MSLKRMMILIYFTVAAVILLGVVSVYALKTVGDGLMEVEEHGHLVETVADLQLGFARVLMPGNDYIITGNGKEKTNFANEDAQLMEKLAEIENYPLNAEEKEIVAGIKNTYLEKVKPLAERILALPDPRHNPEAGRLMEDMDARADRCGQDIEQLHRMIAEENDRLSTEINNLEKIAFAVVALVSILVTLLGIIVVLAIRNGLVKPILILADSALTIADGDLTREIDLQAKGEIGQLAESFRKMLANLKHLITLVFRSAEQVAATSQELASNSGEAAKATQQVAMAIQEVASGSVEQTNYINNTVETVKRVNDSVQQLSEGTRRQINDVDLTADMVSQMAQAIREVAAGAQSVAESAEKTKQAADTGARAVDASVQGMDGIKERVFDSANKIRKLGEHSQQIGEIIQVIDDIAEQTNLLALNAAIEAARAGEHGKGFAVVADEVRKLAERSGKATKEIADLILNIQKLTAAAVAAMEEGTNEVEQGVGLVTSAGKALKDILETVDETYRQIQNISAAVEQISASSEEVEKAVGNVRIITGQNTAATGELTVASADVAKAMENISAITEESSASAEEVSASTEQLTASLEEISAATEHLAKMAEELRMTVGKFKV
ncbi:methyl-accepting chemotaxis protein [Thermincola ferriacetica]